MSRTTLLFTLSCLLLAMPAGAAVTAFTDAAAFEAELSAGAYLTVLESFEDDAVWGEVRTTIVDGPHTALSVSNGFVTFEANNPGSGVTTGHGPARTGEWGFFELPHGDPDAGIHDGWIIRAEPGAPIFAVGGWFETNTFGARLNFVVDGSTVVDFEDQPLDYAHQFYGVIVDEGFETVEVVETESTPGDEWYFIFADDVTVAVDIENAVPDAAPLAGLRLLPNVPNPFNPRTEIVFELEVASSVDLRVYDLAGRLVRVLADQAQHPAGRHRIAWNGRDRAARALPAGSYCCEIVAGAARSTRWVSLVR